MYREAPDSLELFDLYEAEQERLYRVRKRHAHEWYEEEFGHPDSYDDYEEREEAVW